MDGYKFSQNDLNEIKAFVEGYRTESDMIRACELRWRLDAVSGINPKHNMRYGQYAWFIIFEKQVLSEKTVSLPCLFYSNDKVKCDALMYKIHADLVDHIKATTGMSYEDVELKAWQQAEAQYEVKK